MILHNEGEVYIFKHGLSALKPDKGVINTQEYSSIINKHNLKIFKYLKILSCLSDTVKYR